MSNKKKKDDIFIDEVSISDRGFPPSGVCLKRRRMPRKITIKTATISLRKSMLEGYDTYTEAAKKMASYEGKVIDNVGIDVINKALADVQDSFMKIYPVLNFIETYKEFASKTIIDYAEWIERIKQAGAQDVNKQIKENNGREITRTSRNTH